MDGTACGRRTRTPGSCRIDLSKPVSATGYCRLVDGRPAADGVKHIPFPPLFKRADGSPMAAPPRTPLAEGKVFYVGQPVAAIVAETREQAQDAAELALVEYEDLPCVVDPREAIEAGRAAALAAGERQRRRRSALRQCRRRSKKRSRAAAHVTRHSSCTTSA